MARVTSRFWVGALLRRAQAAGAFAAVRRVGSEEAGAIYVVVDNLAGKFTLYGPAMQASYEIGQSGRLFETIIEQDEEPAVRSRLEQEQSFDPDIWIVEIEDRENRNFLADGAL